MLILKIFINNLKIIYPNESVLQLKWINNLISLGVIKNDKDYSIIYN